MKTSRFMPLLLLVFCTCISSAQVNRTLRWYALSTGSYDAHASNLALRGIVGQQAVGTTRSFNLVMNGGYLADTYLGQTVLSASAPLVTPSTYELRQNYPNPFNPITIIKYTVAGTGGWELGPRKTMLVVYDLLGREVATLVNEEKAPGNYEVSFDASKLSSGVYFCRMVVGNFVQTRKLCLVK